MRNLTIIEGDLSDPKVIALLKDHLDQMSGTSPPESRHALDISGLMQSNVYFCVAKVGEEVAGCAAIKRLDAAHGEVKSMKTAEAFLRKGISSQLMQHLIDRARTQGMSRLSLETGSMSYFQPAHAMYKKVGFVECAPFGSYKEDPNSLFMTLAIDLTE
jgi:putative acetyltransferase